MRAETQNASLLRQAVWLQNAIDIIFSKSLSHKK